MVLVPRPGLAKHYTIQEEIDHFCIGWAKGDEGCGELVKKLVQSEGKQKKAFIQSRNDRKSGGSDYYLNWRNYAYPGQLEREMLFDVTMIAVQYALAHNLREDDSKVGLYMAANFRDYQKAREEADRKIGALAISLLAERVGPEAAEIAKRDFGYTPGRIR